MSSDLIGEWCEYHHNLNNIGQNRRVAQLRVLRALEATLPGPPVDVDARDLERYMAQLIRDGYHPHTVVFNLSLIRPFLHWMRRQGMIEAERWLRLCDVKGPRGAYDGKPRPYSRAEIRRFWHELEARYPWTRDRDPRLRTAARGEHWVRRWADGSSPWRRVYPYARRLQIEAVTVLALYGGLRRDEIYNMALAELDYESEYLRVGSRKGPDGTVKIRVVPMSAPMRLGLGNWLEFRAQVIRPEHEFPWLRLYGNRNRLDADAPMSHTQFSGLLRKIGSGWEFHRMRHTYGTERYRAGMPIEILKETLGHERLQQTLGYAQITEDRIIAASQASDAAFTQAIQAPTSTDQEAA